MGRGIGGLLEQLIGPPGGFIFLALLGLIVMRRYRRVGLYLTTSGLGLLYVASLPATAFILMSWLENAPVLSPPRIARNATLLDGRPQAIVIMGAGRRYHAPEYAGDIPNAFALERIRYGVWLARRTMLPILITGGLGAKYSPAEAEIMKKVIESDYALPVRWIETQSSTTHDNAKNTAQMLKAEGINTIYLVTHALHMKRSVSSFEKYGFKVFPAPTAFNSSSHDAMGIRYFLPNAKALNQTAQAFHEWVGILWYQLRY